MYFTYGEKELDFLRQKDKRLAKVIDRIGPVHRTVCLLYTSDAADD